MNTSKITINTDSTKSIFKKQEEYTKLHNEGIIDTETYHQLLDESCNELFDEDDIQSYYSISDEDVDFDYIYRVEIYGTGKKQKIYFKDALDTHIYFDMEHRLGKVKVRYIKVDKTSPEYESAVFNSKPKLSIPITKPKSKTKPETIKLELINDPNKNMFVENRNYNEI